MKRLLIALLVAVTVLGVLAAPAFADLRPSVKTAYVVPKLGVWLEVKGDVNIPVKYGHPLSYAIPAFNPSIGAKAYANHWWGAVTGATSVATKLTSDKKLAQGTYAGELTETVVRTITDLKLNAAGQTTPVKLLPGTKSYPFTFVVGAPVP